MQEYRLHDGQMVTARRKLQKPNARMRRQVSGKLWLEFEGKEPVVIPVLSLKYHVTIYIYICPLVGTMATIYSICELNRPSYNA